MIKKLLLLVLMVPLLLVLVAAFFLVPAHWQIRQIHPPLPQLEAVARALQVEGGARSISYINTATQAGPLGTLGHPGVLIEWADGSTFLIDTGMPPVRAAAFGRPMELLLGAGPTQTFGAIDEQLGDAVQSISGIAFTHLHSDHTDGLSAICASQAQPATVFQTAIQRDEINYTTKPGEAALDAARCTRETLGSDSIKRIPGFPGLLAIAAGGHTPGSTIFAVQVDGTNWVFSGDITNDMRSLHDNLDKPWAYSALIVPEDTARLQQLRLWLEDIDQRARFSVLAAHDIDAFAASPVLRWSP